MLAAGSRTGQLLILSEGAAIVIALLYVAAVLARRLDGANQALIELKNQLQAGQPRSVTDKTIEKVEALLGPGGTSL